MSRGWAGVRAQEALVQEVLVQEVLVREVLVREALGRWKVRRNYHLR